MLPQRVRRVRPGRPPPGADGGATEAAIWSNIYEIGASLDGAWSSIPYGQAMMNQRMYILDGAMQQCPVWARLILLMLCWRRKHVRRRHRPWKRSVPSSTRTACRQYPGYK